MAMSTECLTSGSSMENFKWESAPKRYKDTLKASQKDFNIPLESWNRQHKVMQSGEALSGTR